MKSRRIFAGALAVVLAAAGTAVLVMYVRGAEQRALAGQEAVSVLVVNETITEGTPVEEIASLVENRQIPASVRAEGSVDDLATLDGQVAAVDLMPGEQVVAGRFVDPATFEAASKVDVPEGMQIITVDLEAERVIGGQVVPGDTVGVVVSFSDCEMMVSAATDGETEREESPCTAFLLHKVLVTNVQGSAVPEREDDDQRDGQPDGTQMISLAVDAADAERIVYGREFGTLWLTNEPEDATEDGAHGQTRFSIFEHVDLPEDDS